MELRYRYGRSTAVKKMGGGGVPFRLCCTKCGVGNPGNGQGTKGHARLFGKREKW